MSSELNKANKELLELDIIDISGFITKELSEKIRTTALLLPTIQPPVKTLIFKIRSTGGDMEAGLDIYDQIKHLSCETIGLVDGYAESIAAIILQACKKRLAYPHSHIMIHGSSAPYDYWDFTDQERCDDNIETLKDDLDEMCAIFSKRTGLSKRRLLGLMKISATMKAPEAKKLGFIDEIIE